MKKTLSSLILIAPLMLTACNSTPETVNFTSPGQWDAALAKTDIECDRNEWRENNIMGAEDVADCYDSHGAVTRRLIFSDQDAMVDRIAEIVDNDWFADIPAVVTGEAWMVECASVEQCEMWRDGLGGKLTETPEFANS